MGLFFQFFLNIKNIVKCERLTCLCYLGVSREGICLLKVCFIFICSKVRNALPVC